MNDILENLPNIFFDKAVKPRARQKIKYYSTVSNLQFDKIHSSFGIALHMHQPTIPAGGEDLHSAPLISNLQYMMDHQQMGDNHNAPVFFNCYQRLAEMIPNLVREGKNPRVMLDYSGNLLWGLRQMQDGQALENLKKITCDKQYYANVEWLGTMWSHAVVSSTPIPDIKLHLLAWRQHFASIFGEEVEQRVKGFSPPEMHLPIHPDVCYEYVKALNECGYAWLMVQEHTIQNPDGSGIKRPHFPHRLVAKNSLGETAEIIVLIKTQGSDTKLVAQMQPAYEAKTLGRQNYAGQEIPPFVLQIGDGENGGVMMNEFPSKYIEVSREIGQEGVVALNGSEYLKFLQDRGVDEKKFMPVQPVSQHRIWQNFKKNGPGAADAAIEAVRASDPGYNLDKASWTSDRNWVDGYQNVLDPINRLSAAFHRKFSNEKIGQRNSEYREALLYLLLSQTSCFRYWGEGLWTDYAKELCRRGMAAICHCGRSEAI